MTACYDTQSREVFLAFKFQRTAFSVVTQAILVSATLVEVSCRVLVSALVKKYSNYQLISSKLRMFGYTCNRIKYML